MQWCAMLPQIKCFHLQKHSLTRNFKETLQNAAELQAGTDFQEG